MPSTPPLAEFWVLVVYYDLRNPSLYIYLAQGATISAHQLKRQWGTERLTTPLPRLHGQPSYQQIAASRLAMVATVLFWLAYVLSTIFRQLYEGPTSYFFTLEAIGYLVVVTFLTFSSLMYLVARQGAYLRFGRHVRVPHAVLEGHFSRRQPSLTVLVPSYQEELPVIRKTLVSAALQEYPDLHLVLLLDDDYSPRHPAYQLVTSLNSLFAKPAARARRSLAAFEKSTSRAKHVSVNSLQALGRDYAWSAAWLISLADQEKVEDHVDIFFADQVLRDLAADLQLVSRALEEAASSRTHLSRVRVRELHERLIWIFTSRIQVFQRKKYASLSHDPSKAMNLNSYISLMGGKYRQHSTPEGLILLPAQAKSQANLVVPDSQYLLTLDADSILLRDYCLRLVYYLEQPAHGDVAVTQTPYSSFRGAPTRIERLSGATTDLQHILHQGMSAYGATFWVGANAVIRKSALEDIVETEWVGRFAIKRYIQDRTVIEDTDSSLDLALHGWRLINYPERLSYSATPPDFGSLIIQRRRWANGGLLILPKLWRQISDRKAKLKHSSPVEIMLRLNYMASIAWANFGLIFLLIYPYDGRLLSPLVLLAAVPYFLAMGSDLKYCRYKASDVIRIYGFNLILLPVNLAGVLKSLQQGLTSAKIPFGRTPKIKNRTAAPLPFVLAPLFIVAFSLFTLLRNIREGSWGNAAVAGFNALAASWAILAYIGLGNLLADIWLGITNAIFVEPKRPKLAPVKLDSHASRWRSILYHGDDAGVLPVSELGSTHASI